MQELLQVAVAPENIVFTILLVVVLMYWLTVLIGVLDFGSFDLDFDFDADVDVDVDMDVDVDTDTHVDSGHGPGWIAGALHFFNFGRLPFMVMMTFLILMMWSISILTNYYWGQGSLAFAAAMFFPNLFVSLLVSKVISSPLVPIFKKLDGAVDPVDYVGLTCKMILPASSTQVGQAEVMLEDDSPLLISVKVEENANPILKGENAVILRSSDDERYYIVRHLDEEI